MDHEIEAAGADCRMENYIRKTGVGDSMKAISLASECWSWMNENVAKSAYNSGIAQPLNAIANIADGAVYALGAGEVAPRFEYAEVTPAESGEIAWWTQNLSGALAGTLPYALSGKILGSASRGAGRVLAEKCHMSALGGQMALSERTAQIAGAALYDGARDVRHGETRLGNALGGAASFTVFEKGNAFSRGVGPTNVSAQFIRRAAIGGAGALVQSTVSELVSNGALPGVDKLKENMVHGAMMNIALPAVQEKLGAAIDSMNMATGRGLSLERYMTRANIESDQSVTLDAIASRNLFVRVKTNQNIMDGSSFAAAEHRRQIIHLPVIAEAPLVGHELTHLELGREAGKTYGEISQVLRLDHGTHTGGATEARQIAWQHYRDERLRQEQTARLVEHQIGNELLPLNERSAFSVNEARTAARPLSTMLADFGIHNELTPTGKTYEEHWKAEFEKSVDGKGNLSPEIDYARFGPKRHQKMIGVPIMTDVLPGPYASPHGFDNVRLAKFLTRAQNVKTLDLAFCQEVSELSTLPQGLEHLEFTLTKITELPDQLPPGLQSLQIPLSKISRLPSMPDSLRLLNCKSSQLTELPESLPGNLKVLLLDNTPIKALPAKLPPALAELSLLGCANLQKLTALPAGLEYLDVRDCPAQFRLPRPLSPKLFIETNTYSGRADNCPKLTPTVAESE